MFLRMCSSVEYQQASVSERLGQDFVELHADKIGFTAF